MKKSIQYGQLKKIVFLIIIFLSNCSLIALAQIDPGGEPDVPIDGGLSLLVAAGVGYGIKELRKKKESID
jgi:hypothetical protein